MIKFKAWNASNSRAIAKFHNAEIGHFGHNPFIHELIRGSLITGARVQYSQKCPFIKEMVADFLLLNTQDRYMGIKLAD